MDKDERKMERVATVSDIKTDGNQSFRRGIPSSSNYIINMFEEKHEAMIANAKRVLEELQKKYKNQQGKRKAFQNKRRVTKIKELAYSLNKRKTIASNLLDSKLMPRKEITSLEKLKTSRFLDAKQSR